MYVCMYTKEERAWVACKASSSNLEYRTLHRLISLVPRVINPLTQPLNPALQVEEEGTYSTPLS